MFQQLGFWLTDFLTGYVATIVSTLASLLTPVALIWLTVYIANFGYAVMRGEAQEPVGTFAWKMVKLMFITALALSAGRFMDVVFNTADGIQDGMATIFIKGAEYNQSAPTTVFGALDAANDRANALLKDLWAEASMWRLDLVVASVFFSVGSALFLVLGTFVALLSKVILAFAMAVGPIAILTLMFKPTSKFFDAWLSTVLSAVVLAWFVFFALGLSFYVVQKLLDTMRDAGAFTPGGAVNAVESAVTYLVFMLMLAILLYQAPQLASALTGGASIQTGGRAVAAGAAVSRLFSSTSRGGTAAFGGATPAGGSITRGAGMAHAAGRAAAAAVRAATGNGATDATGLAAYQRVARRGNRA